MEFFLEFLFVGFAYFVRIYLQPEASISRPRTLLPVQYKDVEMGLVLAVLVSEQMILPIIADALAIGALQRAVYGLSQAFQLVPTGHLDN